MAISELLIKAGSGGNITGVDVSDTMIKEAKGRLSSMNSQNAKNDQVSINFCTGDAQNLTNFESDTFDICRSDRSLQHMPDPKAAIKEMTRIAKPGVGRIIVSEPDWETLVIDSPSHGL